MIVINDIDFFSSNCKKDNNEDNYGVIDQFAYCLCDGVGGQKYGEVASNLIVNTLTTELLLHRNEVNLNLIFEKVFNSFNSKIDEDSVFEKMATTLTLTILQDTSIVVAWCGDSRVYHIRNGNILYQTLDHSWINEAVKHGIIKLEESFNHPNRHILTKAIQYGAKSSIIDTEILIDLRDGDYLLHCSDGVQESWNNHELMELFQTSQTCSNYIRKIKNKCELLSKDNSTAILYKISIKD